MAQFDNVTYEHYSGALGRAIVPTPPPLGTNTSWKTFFILNRLLNDGLIKGT